MAVGKKSARFLVITPLLVLALFGYAAFHILKPAVTVNPFPGVAYTTVKAYLYRLDNQMPVKNGQQYEPSVYDVIPNGVLSSTVENPEGVTLSPAQIQMLLQGIHVPPSGFITSISRSSCMFNPHHAFVFYDASGKPVITVAICTMCEDIETDPRQSGDIYNYDFDTLDALLEQLHLPVLRNEDDLKAYRESLKKK
jgi:hypothetical protein